MRIGFKIDVRGILLPICFLLSSAGVLAEESKTVLPDAVVIAATEQFSASIEIPKKDTLGERSWTQLVWNKATGRLERRELAMKDGLADTDFNVSWHPDNGAYQAGRWIQGEGTVVFRKRNSSVYDSQSFVASLTGKFVDGAMTGAGEYQHRFGTHYEGDWKNGLMHGDGRLYLPNGDQYEGGFAFGRLQGRGTYIASTGAIFDGNYENGLRDGHGEYYPAVNVDPFSSLWSDGRLLMENVVFLPKGDWKFPKLDKVNDPAGLRVSIGVAVDQTVYRGAVEPNDYELQYKATNFRDRTVIAVKNQELIKRWKKSGPIAELSDYLFLSEDPPVPLLISFANKSGVPLQIKNLYLNVLASRPELEPALGMSTEGPTDIYQKDDGFVEAKLRIENAGWSAAKSPRLSFQLGSGAGPTKTISLNDIKDPVTIDFERELQNRGLDVARLRAASVPCYAKGSADNEFLKGCLRQFGNEQLFGPFVDDVFIEETFVKLPVIGELSYTWQDDTGQTWNETRSFSRAFFVGKTDATSGSVAEYGAGEDLRDKPIDLQLQKTNYRLQIPFFASVPPGSTARWRISLQAEQASNHLFEIVVETAQGDRISTRLIEFQFVRFDY